MFGENEDGQPAQDTVRTLRRPKVADGDAHPGNSFGNPEMD